LTFGKFDYKGLLVPNAIEIHFVHNYRYRKIKETEKR